VNALYITSLAKGAGKTAVAASLVALLKEHGKAAGYIKPVAAFADAVPAGYADADAAFCKQALGLAEPITVIAPAAVTVKALVGGLSDDVATTVRKRYADLSKGKDTVVIDGLPAAGETAAASKALAALCDAKVVAVVPCARGMAADEILALKGQFGERFLGVILNNVPELSMRAVREETVPALSAKGLHVLGVIPQDRLLLSLSVADYTQLLGGRVVNSDEKINELVEHIVLGANVVDSSEFYYERSSAKALVTRADRPDLQWSALGEKTRCVILTGGKEPIPYVLDRAAEAGVPVVVVSKSTLDTVAAMEMFVTKATFHYSQKLARAKDLLRSHADMHALGA
jgi:BioD-like phosphotransacetylase family protein